MNENLNALIERLQRHDHPQLLEYIPDGNKRCDQILRNILRMQGYNLSYVHQVIESLTNTVNIAYNAFKNNPCFDWC